SIFCPVWTGTAISFTKWQVRASYGDSTRSLPRSIRRTIMYSIVLAAAMASSPMVPDWTPKQPNVVINYGNYHHHWYRDYYRYRIVVPVVEVPAIEVPAAAPARLIVNLPADAKLFLDDQPTTSRATERTFITPALEPGKVYTYKVRVEIGRDGQMLTETK